VFNKRKSGGNSHLYTVIEYQKQFEQFKRRVRLFLSPIPDTLIQQKPAGSSWSIGACIGHINVTGEKYLEHLSEAYEKAEFTEIEGSGSFAPRVLPFLFISLMQPPAKWKIKAPSIFKPGSNLKKKQLLEDFNQLQDQLLSLLEKSKKLDLSRIKLSSPLIPLFRINASECFAILIAHQNRHLWQAEKILKELTQRDL